MGTMAQMREALATTFFLAILNRALKQVHGQLAKRDMKLSMFKGKPVKCALWRPVKKGEECCCGCEGMCIANAIPSPRVIDCMACPSNTTRPNHFKVEGFDYSTLEKPLIKRVLSYFTAEASLAVEGTVSKKIFNQRMNACKECEYLIETEDAVGHCGECGCSSSSKRSGLTVKGTMPRANCPMGRWNT